MSDTEQYREMYLRRVQGFAEATDEMFRLMGEGRLVEGFDYLCDHLNGIDLVNDESVALSDNARSKIEEISSRQPKTERVLIAGASGPAVLVSAWTAVPDAEWLHEGDDDSDDERLAKPIMLTMVKGSGSWETQEGEAT